MKFVVKAFLFVVVPLAAAAGAVRGYMVWQQNQDVLPEFRAVPDGPRAPRSEFVGLEVRRTTLAEAETVFRGLGADCEDTSMRMLMRQKRESVQKKMAAAEARGENPDTVSGASLANYKSKKERNPQVRLACDKLDSSMFKDRERAPGKDLYWVMTFDSPKHPLRHVSIARRFADQAIAAEEWRAAVDGMTRHFGAPTKLQDINTSGAPFSGGTRYSAEWSFADVRAEVSAFLVGDQLRFTELVEVPWPVTTTN